MNSIHESKESYDNAHPGNRTLDSTVGGYYDATTPDALLINCRRRGTKLPIPKLEAHQFVCLTGVIDR